VWLPYHGSSAEELKEHLAALGYALHFITRTEPGRLAPIAAGDVQTDAVIDLVAWREQPGDLAPWFVSDPLTADETAARLRAAATDPAPGYREYAAFALRAAPPASGKTALAIARAERTTGVIINADSAQIYRDLPILSAAPSAEELRRAEHRLYGIRDGADACSAADWALLARTEIAEVQAEGRLPILVGGTGLYIRTLLDGIAPVPPIDPAIRRQVREASVADNLRRLQSVDPQAARSLNAGDTTRISRALEVALSTGQCLSAWQGRREGGIGTEVALRPLILLPPRPWLYERCDARFAAMVSAGAVDEVRAMRERGLDPTLPVMRAIGLREIGAYVSGQISLEQAVAAGQQATRNYAKRQYTWFAHQPPADWPRWHQAIEQDLAEPLALLAAKE
jgi:tRNA dimethylallyltransferase